MNQQLASDDNQIVAADAHVSGDIGLSSGVAAPLTSYFGN